MNTHRNVLFITADQWRGDTLGIMNHPCVGTPYLDKLARQGCLFRRHYGQTAPCGPARASLLTGQYLLNHRVVSNGTPLSADFSNIALEVRRHGREPTLIGYTDQTPDPRTRPADDPALRSYEGILPGFTVYLNQAEDVRPWRTWLRQLGYPDRPYPQIYGHQQDYPGATERGATFPPAYYPAEHSDSAFITDTALGWMQNHAGEPWFLHLTYLRPHPPWVAPEPYHAQYHPDGVPPPQQTLPLEHWQAQHPYLAWHLSRHGRGFMPAGYTEGLAATLPWQDALQARATYYGLISELDAQIGRLLDYLATSGEDQHTLVVFTSDHGEHLGDHYLWGKHGYFDEAYHIPLIIRDPEGQPGQVVEHFSEAVDIMPTLLAWLGMPVPLQCDGESLLPWLRAQPPSRWRDAAHWEFDFRQVRAEQQPLGLTADQCQLAVLRDDDYKYVHFPDLPPLLFDLREDPQQGHNLADDPGYIRQVRDYAQRMLSWRMRQADRRLANRQAGAEGIRTWYGPRY